ncbi:hypothetical protein FRC08_013853, partial [Ceratobasidium sp. 394]
MGVDGPANEPPTNNDNSQSALECVIEQITQSELIRPRQYHIAPNEVDDEWYLHDHDDDEDNDLFGRPNPNGANWDALPEEPPESDPFNGLTAEEILGLSFAHELMSQI